MTILYTNGCSFTYGDELENPDEQCWPAKLAHKLNWDLVNNSCCGGSISRLIRLTCHDILNNNQINLAIIQFPPYIRTEFPIATTLNFGLTSLDNHWTDYHYLRLTSPTQLDGIKASSDIISKLTLAYSDNIIDLYYRDHYNDDIAYIEYLRNIILLQSFLKQNNIKYLFLNAFNNQDIIIKKLNDPFLHSYYKQIDTKYFMGWPDKGIVEWTYGLPQMPKGHPGPEAHELIAEIIYEKILEVDLLPI